MTRQRKTPGLSKKESGKPSTPSQKSRGSKTNLPTKQRSNNKTTTPSAVPKTTARRPASSATPLPTRNDPAEAAETTKQLATVDRSVSPQGTDQSPTPQGAARPREHQEITAARILGVFTLLASLVTAFVTIATNYPQYLINLNNMRATQTANSILWTQTAQMLSATEPLAVTQSRSTDTPASTITPSITVTYTLEPDKKNIKRFFEGLTVMTERAISEENWDILEDYYCGEQSSKKLENFRLWVATLGGKPTARRIADNSSLEIIALPEPNIDWKVVQIETWLFSGDRQEIALEHIDKYTYFLTTLSPGTYCIWDYETDLISHDIRSK